MNPVILLELILPPADRRLERVPLVPLEARLLTVLRAGLAIVSQITNVIKLVYIKNTNTKTQSSSKVTYTTLVEKKKKGLARSARKQHCHAICYFNSYRYLIISKLR